MAVHFYYVYVHLNSRLLAQFFIKTYYPAI